MFSATNTLIRAKNFKREKIKSNYYYREVYLKSDHWKFLREEKLRINPVCQKCGKYSNLDVHHKEYKGLYDVKISDLVTLCRKCHELEHKNNKKDSERKNKKYRKKQKKININNLRFEKEKKDICSMEKMILKAWPEFAKKPLLFVFFLKWIIFYCRKDIELIKNLKREKDFNTYISIHY